MGEDLTKLSKEELIDKINILYYNMNIDTNRIDQLESREQKLIEKLEEDLNDLGEQTKDNYLREKANYTIRYLSEYRKILKGEKE